MGAAVGFVGADGFGRTVSPSDPLPVVSGLSVPTHDEVELSYTGDNLTGVVYKLDGATVMTLELSYSNGKLVNVKEV